MKITNLKNNINQFINEVKSIDLKDFYETINNLKLEDIKSINFRRLFNNLRRSKYTKPSLGLAIAAFLTTFILIPQVKILSNSFKKVKQYKFESNNLQNYRDKLSNEEIIFDKISTLMSDVNGSILKKDEVIFVTRLINEASRKSNVRINSFSPIIKADASKLCKISKMQLKDKNLKSRNRKKINLNKGAIENKFFEVKFASNYLDILSFLKELQLYDVLIIPYCLEVNSDKIKSNKSNKIKENTSTIVKLDNYVLSNNPSKNLLSKTYEINPSDNSGQVETRIILKIPSLMN